MWIKVLTRQAVFAGEVARPANSARVHAGLIVYATTKGVIDNFTGVLHSCWRRRASAQTAWRAIRLGADRPCVRACETGAFTRQITIRCARYPCPCHSPSAL